MPYRIELATPADDADLRQILAATPMAGSVSLAFHRDPSFFAAAHVEGSLRQVVAARDTEADRVVGFGCRCIRRLHVNGEAREVGYLSSLRLLPKHRNRGLVARGYAFFKKLHGDGAAPFYLTTIAEGNEPALRMLTSARAGLPMYHYRGAYHTAAVPLGASSARGPGHRGSVEMRPARDDDIPTLVRFLNQEGPRRQFFPAVEAADFAPGGLFHGLGIDAILLAFRAGALVGTLGGWDQSAYRQTVIHAYRPALRWMRPFYNGWARWRGLPSLPMPGQRLHYLTGALPVVKDDDPDVFMALLDALRRHLGHDGADYVFVGLHDEDPLLPTLRRVASVEYTTRLYLACWEDGDPARQALDARVPYLELGTL
jgi:hypothetical protein